MPVKITIPPTVLAVSLADAKSQLNIEQAYVADDTLITSIIKAATELVQNEMQTQLMDATLVLSTECFKRTISLQKNPVTGITKVEYYDVNGALQPVNAANYWLISEDKPCMVEFDSDFNFPSVDDRKYPVIITYQAGYATAVEVPFMVVAAIKLKITDLYEHRGELENGTISEIASFKSLVQTEANWI